MLQGLWDSQVRGGAGQHAFQTRQDSQVGWAGGSISMEACSLDWAHFSSGTSEFTAQFLGASGLLSACHHPGHCMLALLRKQAPDLGCCVFPVPVVNYSGLT